MFDQYVKEDDIDIGLISEPRCIPSGLQWFGSKDKMAPIFCWRPSVQEDPWGLPYKLVLNKLRKTAPALTETLPEDQVIQLVESLFPEGLDLPPDHIKSDIEWAEENDVTIEEVATAISERKKRAGNKKARRAEARGMGVHARVNGTVGNKLLL